MEPKNGVLEDDFPFQTAWKAMCPICKVIVAGFRGKVALKNGTLGVPGMLIFQGVITWFVRYSLGWQPSQDANHHQDDILCLRLGEFLG